MFAPFVRSLTMSSRLQNLIKPPVEVSGMEGRYATAFYSAATKLKVLNDVEKDLKSIRDIWEKDIRLREFCMDSSMQRSFKFKVFTTVLDKFKVHEITKNLFEVICENGRLNKTKQVIDAFSEIMVALRGEVSCTVRTVKPVDKSTEQDIFNALSSYLKPGEKLILQFEHDPAIIGGMIVMFADKVIDLSVSSKIRAYRRALDASS